MSVGVLLVCHDQLGTDLLQIASRLLGDCPARVESLQISDDDDRQAKQDEAQRLYDALNDGSGVLVLTDLYGASPSNIAHGIVSDGQLEVVTGINLPMLLRVFNYAGQALGDLAATAYEGGRKGVVATGHGAEH